MYGNEQTLKKFEINVKTGMSLLKVYLHLKYTL